MQPLLESPKFFKSIFLGTRKKINAVGVPLVEATNQKEKCAAVGPIITS
jgi:hypothetical protein